jgi:N-acetylglucosamine-6-sulfatase
MSRRRLPWAVALACLGAGCIVLPLHLAAPRGQARADARTGRTVAGATSVATAESGGTAESTSLGTLTDPTATQPYAVGSGGYSLVPPARKRPNIVFVLTDDLSMDLLPYMPAVQALEGRGITFSNFFVTDSDCCPSRTSIFTGDFPHDDKVYSNVGLEGGIKGFYRHGDENHTFNLALQKSGYVTAMMGKYLNGYLQPKLSPIASTAIPPGWNEWDVAGWGYGEFNYTLNEDGRLVHYGHQPKDYLTDVLGARAGRFIDQSAASKRPFFLEVASFTPHRPYVPAPRDANLFKDLTAPEPPNFDTLPTDPPAYLRNRTPLTLGELQKINHVFRRRVEDVQSIDDLITRLENALVATGQLNNTYIVFSSDNGLHTGEYRLMPGKLTPYDTDIHVPLVVTGPGIRAGSVTGAMTENVDLAKTFTQLAGTTLPGDGHTLVPLLEGRKPVDWRNAILVEHHGPKASQYDPDAQEPVNGDPMSYEAIRTHQFMYVEYSGGARDLYDLQTDPYELTDLYPSLSSYVKAELHLDLLTFERCHGGKACWAAAHIQPLPL